MIYSNNPTGDGRFQAEQASFKFRSMDRQKHLANKTKFSCLMQYHTQSNPCYTCFFFRYYKTKWNINTDKCRRTNILSSWLQYFPKFEYRKFSDKLPWGFILREHSRRGGGLIEGGGLFIGLIFPTILVQIYSIFRFEMQ